MRSNRKAAKKTRISFQKIFWLLSLIFLLGSCLFYGTRFIKLYKENEKKYGNKNTENLLITKINDNNNKDTNYKTINGEHYFVNNTNNNYLEYSNILFRIIKINQNGEIIIISNNSITSLAYGKEKKSTESYIYKWLNDTEEEYSGIFEKALNNPEKYLVKSMTCQDEYDSLNNSDCENINYDEYITLLSANNFVNIGGKDSYVNNKEYFYLECSNTNNKQWYVNDEGKTLTSTGEDIIGVKPVLTLKNSITYIKGDGTKDNPYIIEDEKGLFGSYVKIDDYIFRIYQVNDNEVRIILNDYLKEDYSYSNISSYHNDYNKNSVAYYLNNQFLNSLSCKNKIKEVNWSNGYYGKDNNYDYKDSLKQTINSKVAMLSIGNIILNSNLSEYSIMTGTRQNGQQIYTILNSRKASTKSITSKMKIVPAISIDKELLKDGDGTINNPYKIS